MKNERKTEASADYREALAQSMQLGFVPHYDQSIRGMVPMWRMFSLPRNTGGDPAGRQESEASEWYSIWKLLAGAEE